MTTTSLPGGTVGAAYQQTLTSTGGAGGNAWTVTVGTLPAGLSLAANGSITGTPTTTGTANFTVQVKDSASATATKPLSIAIATAALSVTTASLPAGTAGVAYQQTLTASGGSGGNVWSVIAGALPSGLALGADGSITGTPAAGDSSSFTVQVKDTSGATATKALSIAIAPATLSVTTASLPPGTPGVAYQQTLAASGGSGGNAWSIISGALPGGLSLGADGSITGTPAAAGTSNFTVQVKDSSGLTANKALGIVIAAAGLSVSTASLPGGTVGGAYQQTLTATGGSGGDAWAIVVGTLPVGLSLSADGTITGTPTAAGTANFTVQVKDSSSATATKALSIAIAPSALTVTTTSLPDATIGVAYQQTLAAAGGSGGNSWTIIAGTLPAGLSLAPDGSITGIPTASGPANFTIQVRDGSGATATKALAIAVGQAALSVTTASLPGATVGAAYQQNLASTGGSGGNAWTVTAGSLPAGLSLGADGKHHGYSDDRRHCELYGSGEGQLGRDREQATQHPRLPGATHGDYVVVARRDGRSGLPADSRLERGRGGLRVEREWRVIASAGLSLSANGNLTGTPTVAGAANFTVQVSDSAKGTATHAFTLVVAGAPLKIETSSLPGASVGIPYSQPLTASGGSTNSYSWSVNSGALPADSH